MSDGRLIFDTAINTSGFEQGVEELTQSAQDVSKNGFGSMASAAGVAAKAITAATAAATAAFGGLTVAAVQGYADTEQLVGGVKTLFGTEATSVQAYADSVGKSADEVSIKYNSLVAAQETVMQNADNAFKTAGLSANEYMETVTSFSAALISSMAGDTEAAAQKADLALTDMSDNANKMGTDMESIQYAYSGFAKQNYTMLDNLKLGYGGTKTEMERLLSDAEKISGVKYDISSYADVIDAIHTIQTQMGITGTTAREAATTISGSINMMKGAYKNFLAGAADPTKNVDVLVDNLVESVKTVADNIVPVVQGTIPKIIDGLSQIGSAAIEYIPGLIDSILPGVQDGAAQLIGAVVSILPDLISTAVGQLPALSETLLPVLIDSADELISSLSDAVFKLLPALSDMAIEIVTGLADSIAQQAPTLIPAAVECLTQIATGLIDNIDILVDCAVQLSEGLSRGFISSIPILVAAVPDILFGIAEAALELTATAFIEIPEKIGDLLSDGLNKYDWSGAWVGFEESETDAYTRAVDRFTDFLTNKDPAHIMVDVDNVGRDFAGAGGRRDTVAYDPTVAAKEIALSEEELAKQIAAEWQEIANLKDMGYITEKEALDRRIAFVKKYYPEYSTTSHKYYKQIMDDRADIQKEAAKEIALSEEELAKQIAAEWQEIANLKDMGYITEKEALDRRIAFVKKYYPEYSATSHKYYKQIMDDKADIQKEADDAQKKLDKEEAASKKEALKEQENTVKDGLNKIIDAYEDAYKELENKRKKYKERLLAIGGDVFDVTEETDKNGQKTRTYTINNIDEQLRKMREYHAYIKRLKSEGASESFLAELNGMGAEDGAEFTRQIANMSEGERKKLYALYNERDKVASELSDDLYADEAKTMQDAFTVALNDLSVSAYDAGVNSAAEYAKGFNEEYARQMSKVNSAVAAEQYSVNTVAAENTAAVNRAFEMIPAPIKVLVQPAKNTITLAGRVVGEVTTTYQAQAAQNKGI